MLEAIPDGAEMSPFKAFPAPARTLEAIAALCGRIAAMLALATVLLCAAVAILRYFFGIGFVWMQELYVATFAATVLLAAGDVYRRDEHVRVDVISRRLSPRGRAMTEAFGVVFFLVPWLAVILYASLANEHSFLRASIAQREGSALEGGLPGVFLIKGLVPLGATLLLLQGVARLIRALATLAGSSAERP